MDYCTPHHSEAKNERLAEDASYSQQHATVLPSSIRSTVAIKAFLPEVHFIARI